MDTSEARESGLGPEVDEQRSRLVELRGKLDDERRLAVTPAVERALELADIQIFLALTYLGHSAELFPEHQ